MKILLIGPPASGKGTISRMLVKELKLPLINTGDLLREVDPQSIWYQPIHEAMDNGLLAPNKIVGGLLKEYIGDSRYENGYVLDGWVRQLSDLENFDPQADKVVYLDISRKTSEERINNRRICQAEGHTYNLISRPPVREGVCDIDGSKLIKREDDSPEVVEKRFEEFTNKTLPVIDYYQKQGKLIKINGEGTPKEVLNRVLSNLK